MLQPLHVEPILLLGLLCVCWSFPHAGTGTGNLQCICTGVWGPMSTAQG